MPDHHETIIRLDHDTKYAEIWTEDRAIIGLMRRIHAEPLDRQLHGQWWRVGFQVLSRGIRLGKSSAGQGKPATEAQLANLAKARAARA